MIYFLPLGDKLTASSRLRVHLVAPYLKAKVGVPEHYKKGDVLIIQKTPNLKELRKAQEQGAKVIYDIDDFYWYMSTYRTMLSEADMVTVDTETKAEDLKEYNPVVIPDALDWDGTVKTETEPGTVGWTGHGNNAQYLNAIGGIVARKYRWRLVTSKSVGEYVTFPFGYDEWSLETVDKDLSKCEMCVYYMPDDKVGQMKGMHKLLKSWAIGIPTYTSRIPDYVKAMVEAGVGEKYLVDDWEKLENTGFDERCREYAMKYKAEEVAKFWKTAIESLC